MAEFSISAANASQVEGGPGTSKAFTFTVRRTGDTSGAGQVNWGVTGQAGGGTMAANAADFDGGVLPSGIVSFAAGETEMTVSALVAGDSAVEFNESFQVTLSEPLLGDTIGTGSAEGIILADETSFSLGGAQVSHVEGNGTGTTDFTFTVFRSGAANGSQTVDWTVAGQAGSGVLAANADDFAGGTLPSGTVTFATGESQRQITVKVQADSVVETSEGFSLTLSNPSAGGTIGGAAAQGTIVSDESSFSIGGVGSMKAEGADGGLTEFTFAVYRAGAVGAAQTVNWAVAGRASAGVLAADAADFDGGVLPSGVVSFAAGESQKLISVMVRGDDAAEFNEGFKVTLSGPSGGGRIGAPTALGAIVNDDGSRYSVGPGTATISGGIGFATEGTGGTTPISFIVSRIGTGTSTDTLDWAVSGGSFSGTDGADAADFEGGVLPSGTVTFAAGEMRKTVTVNLAADATHENVESMDITISNPSVGAAIGKATGTVIVIDDDAAGPILVNGDGDVVPGTEGDDVFLISAGQHSVAGLGGADIFRLAAAADFFVEGKSNGTVIADFDADTGDRIDLTLLDGNSGTPELDAFSFIDTAAFSNTAGELAVISSDASTQILGGDVNGDGTADFVLVVASTQPATSSWFTL